MTLFHRFHQLVKRYWEARGQLQQALLALDQAERAMQAAREQFWRIEKKTIVSEQPCADGNKVKYTLKYEEATKNDAAVQQLGPALEAYRRQVHDEVRPSSAQPPCGGTLRLTVDCSAWLTMQRRSCPSTSTRPSWRGWKCSSTWTTPSQVRRWSQDASERDRRLTAPAAFGQRPSNVLQANVRRRRSRAPASTWT